MSEGRILVVDNEPQIRRVMRTTLVADGFEVDDSKCAEEALERICTSKFDLVLLDANMPGMDGLEACRHIRELTETPIIMLTVRSAEKDKVQALEAGADDYVTKPFSMPELLARIHAAMRRNPTSSATARPKVRLGEIEIDFEARQVNSAGKQVRLTPKEFELLAYLAAHPNKTVSHRQLLRAVWGPEYGEEQEYLRVFINHLRKKLEPVPAKPKYLLTDPWVGYRLQLTEAD